MCTPLLFIVANYVCYPHGSACRRDELPDNFSRYLSKAIRYLDMVLDGGTPAMPRWID
jgi:hypothetical protein